MSRRIVAALCLPAFALSGCYSYRLADPAEIVNGAEVRARLSLEEAGRLEEEANLQSRVVTGSVVESMDTSTWMLETRVPGSSNQMFQRVSVQRDQVVEMEIREFSALKTGLLGVAVAAVVGLGSYQAFANSKDNPEDTDTNPPDNAYITWFRFSPW